MYLTELIDPRDMQAGIAAKLITARESGDGQTIYNYGDAALWTPGAWDNPAVRQCRGLIVDTSGHVVARPWAKFFNHGQAETGALDLDAPVEVTDKLDGSLGILHRAGFGDGRPRVATRGSFGSDQAVHATEILRRDMPDIDWPAGLTPLVEIIYPANRIVCDYGDADELRLLGGVWVETGDYVGPTDTAALMDWPGPVADVMPYRSLRDALAAPPRPGAEGMCVRYLDRPHIVKIKQDDYIQLHRIVTGLSERTVWQHLMDDKPLGDLLDPLPDELHPWVYDVAARICGDAHDIQDAAETLHRKILASLPPGYSRGHYADQATRSPLSPYLFQLLDGRDPWLSILKSRKPAGDQRAKHTSEATA